MSENTINALSAMLFKPFPEEGDYTQDGLLYCGKCNTRRQMSIDLFGDGEMQTVPVMCDCQKAAYDSIHEQEKARRLDMRRDAMRKEGLYDRRWQQATFDLDDGRDAKASELCRSYADNFSDMLRQNQGLMLFGGLGTGKTFLAACIGNAVIDSGYSVLMASLPSLISQANEDYGDGRADLMARIQRVDLLILDDVGVERDTAFSNEQAYEIINARYRANRPLVITTNISASGMVQEQNLNRKRTYDRLIEMCKPLMVHGESRRMGLSKRMDIAQARGESGV